MSNPNPEPRVPNQIQTNRKELEAEEPRLREEIAVAKLDEVAKRFWQKVDELMSEIRVRKLARQSGEKQ